MQTVTIYTTPTCGYCMMAKTLLRKKNIAFAEVDVGGDPDKRLAMMDRTQGKRSVPQIFVGETYVGGFEELYDLERAGRLDPLLAA